MGAAAAPWRPLLTGAEAEAALAVVEEIAASVAGPLAADDAAADLADGAAGGALLFAELERAGRAPEGLPSGGDLAAHAVRRLRAERRPAGLWVGLLGVAYAQHQVEGRRPTPQLEQSLVAWVRQRPRGDYDLMAGAVGAGVLALEVGSEPLLEAVVEHLRATAERADGGLTWSWNRAEELGLAPHNVGVAHGVPGIVGLLAGVPEAHDLLEGARAWVLAQRLEGEVSSLPFTSPGDPARLAWCYGDAGAAVALLRAGRDEAALEVAARAAARDPATSGVTDAGLCHGAAGLGHLFGRLWQLTGDDAHAEAGRSWLARALELPRPEAPGLLTGASGLALALLSATRDDEPVWDRALLAGHSAAISHQ
jgi:lantibiotic biosynthesis protein